MRKDILSVIADEDDITNAIVLTHNIDFVFVQHMVLPALRRCGHPTLTIFADAFCAEATYAVQHMVLDSIGRRYRVVPIAMQPGFRFHPKAILLSGQEKGVLLVGSGNLTFGGWRENAEIWCRFDTDAELDGTGPFAAFRDYLYNLSALASLNADPESEIGEAFDGKTRAWAENMESPSGLFRKPGNEATILSQMQAELGDQQINEIFVCAPYFDQTGEALKAIHQYFNAPVKIAVQNNQTKMTADCGKSLSDIAFFDVVDFNHTNSENAPRQAFIHSKWYAFKTGEAVIVFMGSANCSQAALTIPGRPGNAELMVMAALSPDAFEENFIGELEFLDLPPELPGAIADTPPVQEKTDHIRCSAARLDQFAIQVAFIASAGATVTKAFVDDQERNFLQRSDGTVLINEITGPNRHVYLEGYSVVGKVISNKLWIDHENELRTSARKRSVIDAVRSKVQTHNWDIGAWNEIMNLFYKNLDYIPENTISKRRASTEKSNETNEENHYTAEDVFRSDYGPANFSLPLKLQITASRDRVTNLRQLLNRLFGMPAENNVQPNDPYSPDDGDETAASGGVDRPEKLLNKEKAQLSEKQPDVSDKERQRAQKILNDLVQKMVAEDYALQRPPERLSVDLQFAAILLRVARQEKWIHPAEFFSVTHRIWAAFFFYATSKAADGWLAHRLASSENPETFKTRFASPELAAALSAWVFAIPEKFKNPEYIRFYLAYLLTIARYSWIWEQDIDGIGGALSEILNSSPEKQDFALFPSTKSKWQKVMRQGYALQKFEIALENQTPLSLKAQIPQKVVKRGEVLWQGSFGFCIAATNISRNRKQNVEVFSMRSDERQGFSSDFIIPARALLNNHLVKLDKSIVETVDQIFSRISKAFNKNFAAHKYKSLISD